MIKTTTITDKIIEPDSTFVHVHNIFIYVVFIDEFILALIDLWKINWIWAEKIILELLSIKVHSSQYVHRELSLWLFLVQI